jgi:predicted AlkP superfamily pyrophosphatase or phosphodiesterase
MRRVAFAFLTVACAAAAGIAQSGRGAGDLAPTIILISFDGWRWDYDLKAPAPNLRGLMARGIRAESLIPSFPSKTFPNHYTIVTGLYPGHHGIVANVIRDPRTGRTFRMTNPREVRDPMWWGGEPIWVIAERQRQRTAAMFWVGSEAPIAGIHPRYWRAYDESYPANARVDQVLQWLDLPAADRPTLMTLYFEDTDTAGHDDGPESPAVREAVRRADSYLGRLLRGLEDRRLTDAVNIVVVSDHGMAAVDPSRVIALDDYISLDDVDVVDINPTLGLFPRSGQEEAVYRALSKAHARLSVYRKAQTPERWRYRDHLRIPPIVGVVDEGWQIALRGTVADVIARRVRPSGGQHGYDPMLMSMRGLFVAAGPAFKRGATVPAFENVHIYNALAQILGLAPANNDGDPAVARSLLRDPR